MSAEAELLIDEPRLQTVDRALRLLTYLGDHPGKHQLRELAGALQLNKAVVYRLLRTMEQHGYVAQDAATAAYQIGPCALALGRRYDSASVVAAAREPMHALTRESGFSTFLTLPLVTDCVCVDRVEAQTTVRVSYTIGRRLPYHAGAPGKALLAAFDAPRRATALAVALEKFTAKTIVRRDALDSELTAIRRRGFATSTGEVEDNISGIATVISDTAGNPLAALSISGLSAVLHASLFHNLGAQLVRAAESIRHALPER